MRFYPDSNMDMTLCNREYLYYRKHERLNPVRQRRPEKICNSYDITTGQMRFYLDSNVDITIYQREYNYYQNHGRLKPWCPVPTRAASVWEEIFILITPQSPVLIAITPLNRLIITIWLQ